MADKKTTKAPVRDSEGLPVVTTPKEEPKEEPTLNAGARAAFEAEQAADAEAAAAAAAAADDENAKAFQEWLDGR